MNHLHEKRRKNLPGAAGLVVACLMLLVGNPNSATAAEEWQSLFDGKTLEGWKSNEHPDAVKVEDGALRVGGTERSHIFYTGEVGNHDFKNFQLRLKVKTTPGSNSGIYFHTKYEDEGWPSQGYEAQVNNSQEDWRRTGSLYAVEDVRESPAKDDEWFDYLITVDGKHITITVNGETTVDYTEPENPPHLAENPGRKLSSGTIALQGHDPGSVVYYKDIEIKQLP